MSLRAHGLLGVMMAVAVACSADPNAASSGPGASGGASATGAGQGGGAGAGTTGIGGGNAGCMPPCTAPEFCSAVGVCLSPATCAADADCSAGLVCDTKAKTCVPGGQCGGQQAQAQAVAPNLLMVLDRSCSMTDLVNGTPKWTIAVNAIEKMTASFTSKIRFGLTLFPDLVTPACGQGAIPIPVAAGNETAIDKLLTSALGAADPYYPDGPCVTNIDTAMQQAATEPSFDDATRSSYVVLITDGEQSGCSLAGGNAGTKQFITNLYQTKHVPTFVLGFGAQVNATQMNAFADAGGVPNSDPAHPATHYYDAQDQASLEAALTAIASKTLGCVFSLDAPPPDPSKVYVFFDNDPAGVSQDPTHMNGWDYDAQTNEITFYGMACTALQNGNVSDVDIVYGCKQPTPN